MIFSSRKRLPIQEVGPGRAPYAIIEGRYPTDKELLRLASQGVGVHILELPPGEHSLSFLEPVASALTRLIVTDWDCRDVSVLQNFISLTELHLWTDPKGETDLSALPLEKFAGEWSPAIASIVKNQSLQDLMLSKAPTSALKRLTGLEKLSLRGIQGGKFTSSTLEHLQLQYLDLSSIRSVELHVKNLPFLEELRLEAIKILNGIGEFATSDSLQNLLLEDCGEVVDLRDAVRAGHLKLFHAVGTTAVNSELRDFVSKLRLESLVLPQR